MAEVVSLPVTVDQGRSRYRWIICALLFFATTINYMDRQILSLVKPMLDAQLHWTYEQFGWVNAAFQGAYALGYLGFGWFIDRFGTKIGYAVSIFVWSVGAMVHAIAGSITGFVVARIILGGGEGGNFPCAIKVVALWFPRNDRAFATSLFNSGANIGPLIAPVVVPWIAFTWGWQAAFVAAGLIGIVWMFFWLRLYDVPEKISSLTASDMEYINSDQQEAGRTAEVKIPWLRLLTYRQTWSLIITKFMTDPVYWFLLIWLPDFFKQTRGLDIKSSGIYLFAVYSVVTVFSIIGGWFPGYLAKKGWTVTRARKTTMFVLACCVVPIFFVTSVSIWTAVFLIGLAGAAHMAWAVNVFTTASDMFPKRVVASVTGIGGMAGAIGGMIFPVVTGIVLDSFKAAHNVTQGYNVLFSFCAFAYLAAFGLNHLLTPRYEPFLANEAERLT